MTWYVCNGEKRMIALKVEMVCNKNGPKLGHIVSGVFSWVIVAQAQQKMMLGLNDCFNCAYMVRAIKML